MASKGTSGGASSGGAADDAGPLVERLSQISSRTNMMAIETVLRAIPQDDGGYADAATEANIIARRLVRTTEDFAAAMTARD